MPFSLSPTLRKIFSHAQKYYCGLQLESLYHNVEYISDIYTVLILIFFFFLSSLDFDKTKILKYDLL